MPVTWHLVDGKYCLELDDAKAIFINIQMLRTREQELQTILEGLR